MKSIVDILEFFKIVWSKQQSEELVMLPSNSNWDQQVAARIVSDVTFKLKLESSLHVKISLESLYQATVRRVPDVTLYLRAIIAKFMKTISIQIQEDIFEEVNMLLQAIFRRKLKRVSKRVITVE